MNEVFGEENFVAQAVWQKVYSPRMDAKGFSSDHDYIVIYCRSGEFAPSRLAFEQKLKQFTGVDERTGKRYRPRSLRKEGKNSRRSDRPHLFYPLIAPDGSELLPIRSDGSEGCWRWSRSKYDSAVKDGLIEWVETERGWQVYVKQFYDESATKPPSTVWSHTEVGHNHEAVDELRRIFGEPIFENPKPTRLIKRMLQIATEAEEDNIVLDFFAGSSTTAHAMLEFNREDDGDRSFIMVQLPEPTPEDSPARQAGYESIADIGKERIRRVIAQMQQEREGQLPLETRETPEDLGFKVFKLAPSNYQLWRGVGEDTPDAYAEQMALFADPLVDGWTAENVIYEVALKEGYGLNCRIETAPAVPGNTIYRVTDPDKEQSFTICLDNAIGLEDLSALNLEKDDLLICRDVALDDEAAANLALQCRLKTI
jgi:adenine-specific DNA-methyltransferase